jgi:hypothetical protein
MPVRKPYQNEEFHLPCAGIEANSKNGEGKSSTSYKTTKFEQQVTLEILKSHPS